MNSAPNHVTYVARLTSDEALARRIADLFAESLDPAAAVCAAFELPDRHWQVEVHFGAKPDAAALRALIADAAGKAVAARLTVDKMPTRDWVKKSLANLAPVIAGRFVVHGAHDRARVPRNRVGIEIEAATAFGTGHHGTTRGCLLALDHLVKRQQTKKTPTPTLPLSGEGRPRRKSFLPQQGRGSRRGSFRVLDVGTGTGVLAIAAAKALRRRVLASDIDPLALTVAGENARLNTAAPAIEFISAAGLDALRFRQRSPFDLILANILLAPLQRLARPLARLLAPGAHVVLSGLLNNQAQAALIAYRAQGLVLERRIVLDEWTTLVLRRPLSFPASRRDKRALPR